MPTSESTMVSAGRCVALGLLRLLVYMESLRMPSEGTDLKHCYVQASCVGEKASGYFGITTKEQCCKNLNGHGWGLASNHCIPCFKFERDYLETTNFSWDKPNVASHRDMSYSTCTSFGNHWRTFDGLEFLFPGRCSYLLWSDNNHRVTVQMVDCHSYVQCTKILRISVDLDNDIVVHGSDIFISGLKVVVDFNQAFISSNGTTVEKIGDDYFLEHGMLRLRWDTMNTFHLTIKQSDSLSNISKSVGLCGNNNANPFDDTMTPIEERVSDPTKLGNSWMVNDTGVPCLAPAPSVTYMCLKKEDENEAIEACGVLWLPPFNYCHQTVLVKHYFMYCVNDFCAAKMSGVGDNKTVDVDGETKAAICQTLTAYGQICSSLNVTFEWRTKDLCPVKCPLGMIHRQCWPRCVKTCNSMLSPRSINCHDNRCYPGCNCQDGWFLTENTCVPAEECPCSYQGTLHKAGSAINIGCSQCKCKEGGWTCQDLACPKTCSVIGFQHITTFDGMDYEFHGPQCWYTMVELKTIDYRATAMFTLGVLNISYSQIKCLSRTDISCVNAVRVSYRRGSSRYDVIMDRSRSISVNGVILIDPDKNAYVTNDIYVKRVTSLFAMVQGFGFRVFFDGNGKIYVRLDDLFSGKVRGLCGNMDGSTSNEFLSRNNKIEQLLPFIKSFSDCALIWPVNVTLDPIDPCVRKPADPMIFQMAADLCKQITAPNGVFSECLKVINWMQFVTICTRDVCANPTTNLAFCNIISGLAYKCLMVGKKVDWNNDKGLSSACEGVTGYGCQPHVESYSECSSKITRCRDMQFKNPVPDNDDCIPGCSCLDKKLIDDLGQCAQLVDCTCYDRYTNKSYKAGEKSRQSNSECVCKNSTFTCSNAIDELSTVSGVVTSVTPTPTTSITGVLVAVLLTIIFSVVVGLWIRRVQEQKKAYTQNI